MQEEEGVSHWAQVVVISLVEKLLKSNIETVRSKRPLFMKMVAFYHLLQAPHFSSATKKISSENQMQDSVAHLAMWTSEAIANQHIEICWSSFTFDKLRHKCSQFCYCMI